jgi:hypothetical protein
MRSPLHLDLGAPKILQKAPSNFGAQDTVFNAPPTSLSSNNWLGDIAAKGRS